MALTAPPDFVFAGAARAGSTAVMDALRRHPSVFVCQPKEPHFLAYAGARPAFSGPGDEETINRVSVTDEQAYDQLFADAPADALLGDGSVSTLYHHAEAFARLAERNPAAKLVIVLRDPVDRAFSSYQYLTNRGYETAPDLTSALEQEPHRREAGYHHLWHYAGMSTYARSVQTALDTFGADQVRAYWYDDLQADPDSVLHDVQDFLGLERHPDVDGGQRVNASGTPRFPAVQEAMRRASEITPVRGAVKALVPFRVRERIRSANLRSTGLDPAVRAEVAPRFADDLDALEAVLGRQVPPGWRH